ncbi:MAG: sulfatase, partial [Sphingobacterium sp.]
QDRPYNVLVILVDDLRPALGTFGDEHAISPNIDEWSEQAMVFERAYSNQAVCVASRYNLLLGSRSTSTGLYDFGRAFRASYPEAITLPELFKNNGYYTAAIGKVFHVGHNTYNDEQSWTAPHWHDKVVEYADPAHRIETREEALFANKPWKYANELEKGAAWEKLDVADEAYADGRVAKEAVKRLGALKDNQKPFFLAVGFARPHLPFTVPRKYWDLYDPQTLPLPQEQHNPKNAPSIALKRDGEISQYAPIPMASQSDPFPEDLTRKLIHGYYAGVSYVDKQIGKVLHELEESGLDKNTIVVLWGDHGYLLGEMGMWTKHVNYELANRIPVIIKHPEMRKGNHSKDLLETVDIYPTLAELANIPVITDNQPIDGLSFASYLLDPKEPVRNTVYHCFPRGGKLGRAIRNKNYRLIAWQDIAGQQEPVYELYEYRNGLVETENIWTPNHPAFKALKSVLDDHPQPVSSRPESKPRNKS